MTKEQIGKITHTVEGYEVKNLSFKRNDGLITGQVKDPMNMFPHLHEGFVSVVWNRNGYPQRMNKGRKDLMIEIPKE